MNRSFFLKPRPRRPSLAPLPPTLFPAVRYPRASIPSRVLVYRPPHHLDKVKVLIKRFFSFQRFFRLTFFGGGKKNVLVRRFFSFQRFFRLPFVAAARRATCTLRAPPAGTAAHLSPRQRGLVISRLRLARPCACACRPPAGGLPRPRSSYAARPCGVRLGCAARAGGGGGLRVLRPPSPRYARPCGDPRPAAGKGQGTPPPNIWKIQAVWRDSSSAPRPARYARPLRGRSAGDSRPRHTPINQTFT